jgi:two-component system NtrC family sensor kinase
MEQILVVDDHQDLTRVLAESWLPALGYHARAATTNAAAQTALAQHTFDLILLDLHMPDVQGIAHFATIRRTYPDIPVILIMGQDSEPLALEALRLGVRNYLIKPFTFEQVQQAVEDALREQRLQRQNQQLTRWLRQRIHELIVLSAIGRSVTRAIDLDEVFTRIVDAAIHLTQTEEGFLLLCDADQLVVRAARTICDERTRLLRQPMNDNTAEEVLRTRQPVRLPQRGNGHKPTTDGLVESGMLVPLLAAGEVLGVLSVNNVTHAAPLSDEQERLLIALADYAAIAIENVRLFAARQRSEQRYRDLFRNASDILLVVDPRLRVVEVNQVGSKLLGYTEHEIVEQPLQQLVAAEHWPATEQRLRRMLADRSPAIAPFELELSKYTAQRMPVELSVRLIEHDDGQPALFCSVHDLTERLLQTQIAHAEKLAAIERVVAGMAHELNNPLASIAGYTQLLLRDPGLSTEAREDIEHVLKQSHRAGQMVQNLLTIGQDLQLRYTPTDISNLISSTLDLPLPQYPNNITVARDLSTALPPVLGDPYQLQQVLLHLLNNAVHAMQPDGGTLQLRTYAVTDAGQFTIPQPSSPLPTDLGGSLVITEVIDTGSGIAAHQLGQIFDPFWTTKEVGEGPGLGLSMSRGIVAQHAGHIWVHSIAGQGTTTYLALPTADTLKRLQADTPKNQDTASRPQRTTNSTLGELQL